MTYTRVSRLCVAVLVLPLLALRADAGSGPPTPDPIRQDWERRLVQSGGDIVTVLNEIPHDPNPLGVRAAQLATSDYSRAFVETIVPAADGTPLSGMMAIYQDDRPRPGVVIVPGLVQTKRLKFVVELADVFSRNGWHVLTIDPRGQGQSRATSRALVSFGWKEADDVIGAVRHLLAESRASSVAVIGFSMAGRSVVRAMAHDTDGLIAAGMAITTPLVVSRTISPPPPGWRPNRLDKLILAFLGASSFYEYAERAARSYGVDLPTMLGHAAADTLVARVKQPLLLVYALDDFQTHLQLKAGRHDGGTFSLAFRDSIRDKQHLRTMLVDRGNHSGMLYLSDPHWFSLVTLNYLKHWQARERDHVTAAVPVIDVLAEGQIDGGRATYRFVVRNHGMKAVGPLDVHIELPARARAETCWVGFEGLGRCATDGDRLLWTIPRLPGQKSTAGPFVVSADVAALRPGPFRAKIWATGVDGPESMRMQDAIGFPQVVTLEKR